VSTFRLWILPANYPFWYLRIQINIEKIRIELRFDPIDYHSIA